MLKRPKRRTHATLTTLRPWPILRVLMRTRTAGIGRESANVHAIHDSCEMAADQRVACAVQGMSACATSICARCLQTARSSG